MDHRCHRGRPCISHVRHRIRHDSGNATMAAFIARYQLVTIPLIGTRVQRHSASSVVTEGKMTKRGTEKRKEMTNFHLALNMTIEASHGLNE
jgi:hypothetical protein